MSTLKNSKVTEGKSQHARFLETARALGCDEDEAAFDEKLKAIARPSLPKDSDPGREGAKASSKRRKPLA